MSEELKKCPFCGGKAFIGANEFEGRKVFSVYCGECEAGTGASEEKQRVIDEWNKRDDIASCPFCGGKASLCEIEEDGESFYMVACEECGIQSSACEDETEAILAWNKRV